MNKKQSEIAKLNINMHKKRKNKLKMKERVDGKSKSVYNSM